jgi:hypothetical protein
MILVWVALLAAVVALTAYAGVVSRTVQRAAWPEETPLHVHENRAHDQVLPHLARLVAAEDPTPVHRQLRDATERLLASAAVDGGGVDPRVSAFLADPPLASAPRYRAELADVLDRIERL